MAGKGAEQLLAPGAPVVRRASERPVPAAPPIQSLQSVQSPPPARPTSPTVAAAPVAVPTVVSTGKTTAAMAPPVLKELVFKGPPREVPHSQLNLKWLVWPGVGGGIALTAFALWSLAGRRIKTIPRSRGRKDDFMLPRELLVKEPAGSTPGPLMTDNP